MDFSRIGTGHRIAAGAAVLLIIDLWLSWYEISDKFLDSVGGSFGFDTSANAWQAFGGTDLLLFVVALIAIAAAVQHMGPLRLPVRLSQVLLPAAAVMTLWVLYRIINQPGENELIDTAFGAYIGLVLMGLMTYGAMKAQGEHEAVGPADFNTGTTTPATGTTAPPPPPPAASTPPPSDPPPPPPATG
jgi:di/tricarboxylate transporter